MKKVIYIAIMLLGFNACKAQENKKMDEEIIIPKVTKEYETFNIEIFNKEKHGKKRIKKEKGVFIEEDSYSTGYIRRIYYDTSSFKYNKKFHLNTIIKEKGIMFNNGSQYGIWYKYNEKGELIKVIDTDEGYDYGWDKILEYCLKNNIVLTKGYIKSGGVPTEILKLEEEGRKIWQIMYYDKEQEKKFLVKLDGKSGELLSKKELEFLD